MYSTTGDARGTSKGYSHRKTKSKNTSQVGSPGKSKKFKNKQKVSSKHTYGSKQPSHRKNETTLIKQNKRDSSLRGSKSNTARNKLKANKSYTNVLINNDYSRSSYINNKQPSFDITGYRGVQSNQSPAKFISSSKQQDTMLYSMVPYQDLKLQSASDLKKLHDLRQNARSYTDLHQDKLRNSYVGSGVSRNITPGVKGNGSVQNRKGKSCNLITHLFSS